MPISPIHTEAYTTPSTRTDKIATDVNFTSAAPSPLEAKFQANQDYLKLVYQSALEKLNTILAPDLGPNAIQKAYEDGLDVSPEATAGRIVNLSTGLLDRYQQSRPNDNTAQVFSDFIEVIRKGIDQGFKEARDILSGLQVLQGDIQENIDKTYSLVQDKLALFEQQYKNKQNEGQS